MRQNAFGGRALPGPAGEAWALLQTSATFGGAYFQEREGREEKKERDEKGGKRGKGKDDLHPTLFLGPAEGPPDAVISNQTTSTVHPQNTLPSWWSSIRTAGPRVCLEQSPRSYPSACRTVLLAIEDWDPRPRAHPRFKKWGYESWWAWGTRCWRRWERGRCVGSAHLHLAKGCGEGACPSP